MFGTPFRRFLGLPRIPIGHEQWIRDTCPYQKAVTRAAEGGTGIMTKPTLPSSGLEDFSNCKLLVLKYIFYLKTNDKSACFWCSSWSCKSLQAFLYFATISHTIPMFLSCYQQSFEDAQFRPKPFKFRLLHVSELSASRNIRQQH